MGKSEGVNKRLSRVRAPRVHITYEVETGGAMEKRELPFIVGVFADLSGQPATPLPKIRDRKFTDIDNDNFDKILKAQAPRLVMNVPDKLTPENKRKEDSSYKFELKFDSLDSFSPEAVAKQVQPLNHLLELRNKLSNLRSSLYGNDQLEDALQAAVQKTEAIRNNTQNQDSPSTEKEK